MNSCRHILLLLGLFSTSPQAVEFTEFMPARSSIIFAYKQMNVPLEGKFNRFSAHVAFDPKKAHAAQTQIEVELASIDTGFSDADSEIAGKLWLNTQAFPAARFVSNKVRVLGGNRYEALGKLSIKGKTLDVVAPFTFHQEGTAAVFDGSFNMKRLDYAIGEGIWSDLATVANEVQVKFRIVAAASARK